MSKVEFDIDGQIAVVRLNRPEARNAFDPETVVRLYEAFERVREDEAIRVAVLTGTGDTAFCAGADLGRFIPLISGARGVEDEWDQRLIDLFAAGKGLPLMREDPVKPVIAAINGHAIAGGMELAQGTDIRVSCPEAKFGVQEVKWAVFPSGGSTVRLPQQLPFAKAMELLLTGDLISAEDALACGFLNHIVAREAVMDKAMEIAAKIAANGPLAVQAIRKSARACLGVPEAEALAMEATFAAPVFASEDAKEGPRAFMEKRAPVFQGR